MIFTVECTLTYGQDNTDFYAWGNLALNSGRYDGFLFYVII